METVTIDGRRFERNDEGLFMPADSVQPVQELGWFQRFHRTLQAAVCSGRRPGLMIPVAPQGLDEQEFNPLTRQCNLGTDDKEYIWKRLGRAAAHWHYDQTPDAIGPSYRAGSFVLFNDGPENPLRESWLVENGKGLHAIKGNSDSILAASGGSSYWQQFLKKLSRWEDFPDDRSILRRSSQRAYVRMNAVVDPHALRLSWGRYANMALYCNNRHYVHRGVYLPEDDEASVGFLYRHIAA